MKIKVFRYIYSYGFEMSTIILLALYPGSQYIQALAAVWCNHPWLVARYANWSNTTDAVFFFHAIVNAHVCENAVNPFNYSIVIVHCEPCAFIWYGVRRVVDTRQSYPVGEWSVSCRGGRMKPAWIVQRATFRIPWMSSTIATTI